MKSAHALVPARAWRVAAVSAALAAGSLLPAMPAGAQTAPAAAASQPAEGLRPEVLKPLQDAQKLMAENKFAEALALAQEAAKLPGRTPFEDFTIDQIAGQAALRAGQDKPALDAYDRVLATRRLPADQATRVQHVLSQLAFRVKEYKRSASYAQQALAGGAPAADRAELLDLQARALYLAEDWSGSAQASQGLLDAQAAAGQAPKEDSIKLLASAHQRAGNEAGVMQALERLVALYPKPEYWADLLARTARAPGFNSALRLELLRLGRATGAFEDGDALLEAADLAQRAGLPGETRRLIKGGLEMKLFKAGSDTDAARQMLDRANKAAAADQKSADEQAKRLTGQALFGLGQALALDGQTERGLALMQQALTQGGVKSPNEAWLQLGALQAEAGVPAAKDSLAKVQGSDGAAALARFWRLHKKLG